MDRRFFNVLLMGLGFMLLFTAFQTAANAEKVVLKSIQSDDPSFHGDGYTSLAIIYGVFALVNWLAPSIVSVTGPRGAMIIGPLCYCLFIISFLVSSSWLLYSASAMLGFGAAITWTGQGTYLARCSDPSTISRNSAIFWALFQSSLFFGNVFVFFLFQGKTHIDEGTRQVLFGVLTALAVIGITLIGLLRHMPSVAGTQDSQDESDNNNRTKFKRNSVMGEFINAAKLFMTRNMLLLTVTYFYMGIELSYTSGVYSSCVGFTKGFGESAKQLVGLSGVCIGIGEVVAGVLFGLLGSKTTRSGRNPIVISGFVIHIVSYFLIFINLPNSSPFGETTEVSFIEEPHAWLTLLCAGMLGFGDASFNTQVFSMLAGSYSKNSTAAFAIFKFIQTLAAAIGFVYSSWLGLRIQLSILTGLAVIGTVCFCMVECGLKRRSKIEANANTKEDNVSQSDT